MPTSAWAACFPRIISSLKIMHTFTFPHDSVTSGLSLFLLAERLKFLRFLKEECVSKIFPFCFLLHFVFHLRVVFYGLAQPRFYGPFCTFCFFFFVGLNRGRYCNSKEIFKMTFEFSSSCAYSVSVFSK